MKCPQCGKALPKDILYCPKDGTRLRQQSQRRQLVWSQLKSPKGFFTLTLLLGVLLLLYWTLPQGSTSILETVKTTPIPTPDIAGDCGIGGCGDVYVENYRADLYMNGTLEENFVYEIKESGKYRMLYRNWEAPLSQERLDSPYIEPVRIASPLGTIPYAKDVQSRVKILSTTSYTGYTDEIASLAQRNEVGGYKPERFEAGRYEIGYVFKLHPSLECDEKYCHLNLKLMEKHLPYKHITIAIHDPEGFVSQIFTHPRMDTRKEEDTFTIEGVSPENLEIEMLLKPEIANIMVGYPQNVPDVEGKTISANSEYAENTLPTITHTAAHTPIPTAVATSTITLAAKTLSQGESWDMGEGFTLTAVSIDAKAKPKQAWLALYKNGIKLDDKVLNLGETYEYFTRTNNNIFGTKISNIYPGSTADMVTLTDTYIVSGSIS